MSQAWQDAFPSLFFVPSENAHGNNEREIIICHAITIIMPSMKHRSYYNRSTLRIVIKPDKWRSLNHELTFIYFFKNKRSINQGLDFDRISFKATKSWMNLNFSLDQPSFSSYFFFNIHLGPKPIRSVVDI